MSRSPSREDKTCLNCFYVVDKRFCSNCGQENTEPRKTFHHLFVHFIEDLTHYENSFWKTIRNLIFKPASLTKEYLSGKRMSYLAPVRLYIFISFVTFFIISIAAADSENLVDTNRNQTESIKMATDPDTGKELRDIEVMGYKSAAELDSLQKFGPEKDRLSPISYWTAKKILVVLENNSRKELKVKFKESYFRNLPKVLFIYMPIFALVLWLFQSKKKYYYFDHGIFTLHYFSFLLLSILVVTAISFILPLFGNNDITDTLEVLLNTVVIAYMFYYFFAAHHRYYNETRTMSILKGGVMFFINMFLISVILVLFILYTLITMH